MLGAEVLVHTAVAAANRDLETARKWYPFLLPGLRRVHHRLVSALYLSQAAYPLLFLLLLKVYLQMRVADQLSAERRASEADGVTVVVSSESTKIP
jgi:hypothetical protein